MPKIKIYLFLILVFVGSSQSHAGFLDNIGRESLEKMMEDLGALSDQTVREVMDRANSIAADRVNQGANESRLLLLQAGNQMALTSATIASAFGDELENTVATASSDLKMLLAVLNRMENNIGLLGKEIVSLEDTVALDLQDLIKQLPFAGDPPFAVRSISGQVFVENTSEVPYEVKFIGPGFGPDASGVKTTFSVRIDGQELKQLNRERSKELTVKIPRKLVSNFFTKDSIVTKKLSIEATRTVDRRFSGIRGKDVKKAEATVDAIFLPIKAGRLTVIKQRPAIELQILREPEITNLQLTNEHTYTFKVGNPDQNGKPEAGEMKISRDIEISCAQNLIEHRRFPNNKDYRSDLPPISTGWTAKTVAPGDTVRGTFVERNNPTTAHILAVYNNNVRAARKNFNTEVIAMFGNEAKWNKQLRHNFYWAKKDKRFTVSTQELRNNSRAVMLDITGCKDMTAQTPNFMHSDSSVSIQITGKPKAPAPWKITLQPQTYVENYEANPVTEKIEFDTLVNDQMEFSIPIIGTAVTYKFKPFYGGEISFIQPGVSNGFTLEGTQAYGKIKKVYLRFSYPIYQ